MPGPSMYTKLIDQPSARFPTMASNYIKVPNRFDLQDSRSAAYPATVELKVSLRSEAGLDKVKSKLLQMDGVKLVSIDIPKEKVIVTGHVKPAEVLKAVRKVQKSAELWSNCH